MNVTDIFEDYCARVAQVHFQRKLIEDAVRREVARLHEQEHIRSELSMPAHEPFSTQNMSFKSATSGELRFYGFASSTARALIEAQIAVVNRQYQWLLVDAYELFEDYLEGIYASMAVTDKSSWPLRDFGEATIDELPGKNFDWYLEKSRNKKEVPYSILNRIRLKHPALGHVERANHLNVHLLVAVALIEQMRHHIVHTRGVVSKPDDFYAKVLNKQGCPTAAPHRMDTNSSSIPFCR